MASRELRRFTEFGRKIVGIGFNYRCLMKQMQVECPKEPNLYLKATSSYIKEGTKIQIPKWSEEGLWYEIELGIIIGKPLKDGSPQEAVDAIGGYCSALDLTDAGTLIKARETGMPWFRTKSFDTACPVGGLIPKDAIPDLSNVNLWLKVNGDLKQDACTSNMAWPVPDLLSLISQYATLYPGDMVLTGTPAGVGVLQKGDVIDAGIKGVDKITFEVAV